MVTKLIPWTRQPQVPVGVDWSNPLAKGLEIAINPGLGKHPLELAKNRPLVYGTGITVERNANTYGQGNNRLIPGAFASFNIASSSSGILLPTWSNTGEGSLFILQKQISGNNEWLSLSNDTSDVDHFPYAANVYSDAFWSTRWISDKVPPIGYYITDPVYIGISVKAGSQQFVWNDSIIVSGSAAGSFSNPSNPKLGTHGGSIGFNGHFFGVFIWSRALSVDEFVKLGKNPWQLFAPQRRTIFSATGAYTLTQSSTFTNSQTFPGHTIAGGPISVAQSSTFTNSQVFPAHTIANTSAGAQTVTQSSTFTNSASFPAHAIAGAYTLTQSSTFTNSQSFPAHGIIGGPVSVAQSSTFTNSQVFPAHGIANAAGANQTVTQSTTFTNGTTFFTQVIAGGPVSVAQSSSFANSSTFHAAAIAAGAPVVTQSSTFLNSQTFPAHQIGNSSTISISITKRMSIRKLAPTVWGMIQYE